MAVATRSEKSLHLPINLLEAMKLRADQKGIALEEAIADAMYEV